ncbi:hypothetical protein ASF72_10655 [Arthrobacter sp. Leaf141]|uniref:hypothetical protein n=1 Tax=Arthrobacter sp. Leaf141 TaxID=1736273 RepID=UPI0006FE61C9|nr:hypothetical protein [Arthrobacter sp. Leaf141]KQR02486.1 hypothetical protein ASF72_10655 [Arthrobacter sp. Leaf141]
MANLITPEDLASYELEDLDVNRPRVARFIATASEAVTDAARSPILRRRSVVELTAMPAMILRLPGLPISEIHSVTIGGVPLIGWTRLTAGIHRADGWSQRGLEVVTVDYTHGLPAVPADIKDLVARMVIAAELAAQDGADSLALNNGRISSVGIDDFREAYATGDEVEAVTEMTLPERTRERLAKRFGAGPTVAGGL